MNNKENAAVESTAQTRTLPKKVNFDPMQYAREVATEAGKTLTLDLKHKKDWFRLACPKGGVVLNPLRVTDQVAIFEARLFADTDDRNPLASFTATRSADKSTGRQYIRAAQEDALNEALENAGFSLRLFELAQAGQETPTSDTAPPVEEAPPAAAPEQAVQPAPEHKLPAPAPAPRQAARPTQADQPPAATPGQTAQTGREDKSAQRSEQSKPAVGPAPSQAAEKKAPASTVVDIATGQPVAAVQPVESSQSGQTSGGETSSPTDSADMTVEEICQVMTLEQARAVVVKDGTCKGWTLEQVARDRPASLKWLRFACPFGDNMLKAAAQLVLDDLELKAAG